MPSLDPDTYRHHKPSRDTRNQWDVHVALWHICDLSGQFLFHEVCFFYQIVVERGVPNAFGTVHIHKPRQARFRDQDERIARVQRYYARDCPLNVPKRPQLATHTEQEGVSCQSR